MDDPTNEELAFSRFAVFKAAIISGRARWKLVGGGKTKKFSGRGAKGYTQTFLLHFSITIFAMFFKSEGGGVIARTVEKGG